MKLLFEILILVGAIFFSIVCGSLLSRIFIIKKENDKKEELRRQAAGVTDNTFNVKFTSEGTAKKLLDYLIKISYKISFVSIERNPIFKLVKSNELNSKLKTLSVKANMPEIFGNYALRDVQLRIAFVSSLSGALLGCVFSYLLMLVLFIVGIALGIYLPIWALKQENKSRTLCLERYMPEMLEVVALGLRSGLTFDRSFQIYTTHFENNLSSECALAQKKWESGISLREDSLRNLSDTYDSTLFSRVIENIIRSLRFGSSLVESLEEAAVESRNQFRSKQEEIVAKAPVKMMLPTGTLILPAMLILVLGPVLLELTGGF